MTTDTTTKHSATSAMEGQMRKPLAGKTITLPVYVRAEKRSGGLCIYQDVDGFDVRVSPSDYVIDGELIVMKTEITVTIPDDFDPTAPMVAALEAKKAELTAEFTAKVSEINRRLSELQAIDYTPEAA